MIAVHTNNSLAIVTNTAPLNQFNHGKTKARYTS